MTRKRWLSQESNEGGMLALALVDAVIAEDVPRIELLGAQAGTHAPAVITALVTSLAATLETNLGTKRARRQIEHWQKALLAEGDR